MIFQAGPHPKTLRVLEERPYQMGEEVRGISIDHTNKFSIDSSQL